MIGNIKKVYLKNKPLNLNHICVFYHRFLTNVLCLILAKDDFEQCYYPINLNFINKKNLIEK